MKLFLCQLSKDFFFLYVCKYFLNTAQDFLERPLDNVDVKWVKVHTIFLRPTAYKFGCILDSSHLQVLTINNQGTTLMSVCFLERRITSPNPSEARVMLFLNIKASNVVLSHSDLKSHTLTCATDSHDLNPSNHIITIWTSAPLGPQLTASSTSGLLLLFPQLKYNDDYLPRMNGILQIFICSASVLNSIISLIDCQLLSEMFTDYSTSNCEQPPTFSIHFLSFTFTFSIHCFQYTVHFVIYHISVCLATLEYQYYEDRIY